MKQFLFATFLMIAISFNGYADEKTLFTQMSVLAQKGNTEAQYHLGMMYNNGIGVDASQAKAFEWFKKSGASGDPLANYKLGCYYGGQASEVVPTDHKKALEYKLISAKAGYSLAQSDVGNMYAENDNFTEANKYWKLSAAQGFPQAMYNLSSSYMTGRGISKDMSLAYAYFKISKLVSEGKVNPTAQSSLDELAVKMSKPELERANKFVSDWTPKPTLLTIKAKNGLAVAQELIETTK